MLLNYFKLAYRNLLSNKLVSAINIFGLSIAIASCITVFLFLRNHWTMDNFHQNGEQIFIVEYGMENAGQEQVWGTPPMPLGPALARDFPQVERAVRTKLQGCKVYLEDRVFEELVYFADPGYFDMFTFPLQAGTPRALEEPDAVILSAEAAEKYFKGENAVGKDLIIVFENQQKKIMNVKGVAEPLPENTGFIFDLLTGFNTLEALYPGMADDWTQYTRGTFVQLYNPSDIDILAANVDQYTSLHNDAAIDGDLEINSFVFDNLRHPNPGAYHVLLRPVETAHPILTLMFLLMALLMMALSCFNYINIALGFVGKRLKEIGIRKVIGGRRRQLIGQFLAENLLLCFLALLCGLALTEIAFVPLFNSIMVSKISLSFTDNPWLWAFVPGLLVFTGLASGAYPAFYISSLQPVFIFRGRRLFKSKSKLLRVFLAMQFVLAFCTVIIGVLLLVAGSYWKDSPWGYQPDQTLVVRLDNSEQYRFIKTEAERSPHTLRIAGTVNHIGESLSKEIVLIGEEKHEVIRFDVGAGYFEATGLRLAAGRFFDEALPYEDATAVIVNKTFVQERQWAEPLGKQLRAGEQTYRVIGVVDDFKLIGSAATRPVVFFQADAEKFAYLVLRYEAGSGEQAAGFVKSIWQRLYPEIPFSYFHQPSVFDNFYRSYNNVTSAFNYIAGLALIIACLGLFGLSSQNYASYLKEVSIRKVLGASVRDTVLLVNRAFLIILLIAGALATGVCYLGVQLLLEAVKEYTGVVELGITPYLLANVLVFLTAGAAIAGQSYRLARISPAVTLRNE
ncbi:MAG: ABC transporter permease [Calditrichae bacterium]|nr:ABC transporter permease [Calditrichia bacterium]